MSVMISQRVSDSEFPPTPPAPPTMATTQTLPPIDLKHMTSSGALSPGSSRTDARRTSQHLHPRSPNSIPSSPTSVHSSSSAIFERDIEPLVPPSPPHALSPTAAAGTYHPTNPHRIPRATRIEALEHSVPSVLDSAAAVLGSLSSDADAIAVVAPAPFDLPGVNSGAGMGLGLALGGRTSGFASPIGSFRSRSPSPSPRAEALLSASTAPQSVLGLHGLAPIAAPATVSIASGSVSGSPAQHGATLIQRSPSTSPRPLAPPSLVSAPESPRLVPTNAFTASPSTSPRREPASPSSTHAPALSGSLSSGGATPHSASANAAKRLSFMSYADLRASTPATTTSLTQLTSGAGSEPPPHITGVTGIALSAVAFGTSIGGGSAWGGSERGGGSAAPSVHGLSIGSGLGLSVPPPIPSSSSPSPVAVVGPHAPHTLPLLDLGGEWEREGLGKGLEARLEGEVRMASGGSMEEVGV